MGRIEKQQDRGSAVELLLPVPKGSMMLTDGQLPIQPVSWDSWILQQGGSRELARGILIKISVLTCTAEKLPLAGDCARGCYRVVTFSCAAKV